MRFADEMAKTDAPNQLKTSTAMRGRLAVAGILPTARRAGRAYPSVTIGPLYNLLAHS